VSSTAETSPPSTTPSATQAFGTKGIQPMLRPTLLTRLVMRVVAWVERLNFSQAKLGNPPVYDNAVFPWAAEIEREWRAISAELARVISRKDELPGFHEISPDVRTITQDGGWKTFLLCGYGFRSERAIRQCPETWRLLQKIPGLTTAMFSILEPGKHLPPHRGPYNGVLRLHLGLIIPEPREQTAIRVGQEICHWQQGRVLIFDDAYEHEAWNNTAQTRVVLFVDFVKPLRFPASFLNWLLLHVAMFTPFIREGSENQRKWEQRFYAEAEAWRNR
jgi:beta-hydroxylase